MSTAGPAKCAVVAVVTGAGRGIGRAVALELAARGCDVALVSRSEGELDEATAEVRARGVRAWALVCDVARADEVARACDELVQAAGAPEILVNNAGIVRRGVVADLSEEDWDAVIDVNLKGTFLVTRALLPSMLGQGRGRVVNLGSISSTLGTKGQSAYCAAKWGVVGFTKALAEELRGTGLSAVSVLPGSVATAMLEGSSFSAQMTPEEVAKLVVFAALDAPLAMNGSAIEMFGP